jgi:hypothetical protein
MKNKFIITIERINDKQLKDKAKFEIAEDSDLWDWKYLFSAILVYVSFDLNQIKELFNGGDNDEKIEGN